MKAFKGLAIVFGCCVSIALQAAETNIPLVGEAALRNQFQREADWIQNKLADSKGFRASVVETDFAFSTKGFFGRMLMNGTPAVTLYWSDAIENLEDVHLTYDLNPKSRRSESDLYARCMGSIDIEEMIVPALQRLARQFPTARLQPLLEDLKLQLQRSHLILKVAQENLDGTWIPARLGVDYHVDAAAKVSPIGVAGGVSLRFVWPVGTVESGCKNLVDLLLPKLDAVRIAEIVSQYSHALGQLDSDELNIGSMNLEGLRLSIGRTAGGSFVVGSVEAQKWGFIDFARNEDTQKRRSLSGKPTEVEKITDGLRQALKLSQHFAAAASQTKGNFIPQGVTTRFSRNASGGLGLSVIQTKASIALRFLRPKGAEKDAGEKQNAVAIQWRGSAKWSFPWTLGVKIQPEITTVDLFRPK